VRVDERERLSIEGSTLEDAEAESVGSSGWEV
jgi:hypothetical protein